MMSNGADLLQLLKANRGYVLAFALYLVLGLFLSLSFTQRELFMAVNRQHYPVFDLFFYYATSLGNGVMFALLAAGFLFVRYRYALAVVLAVALQTLVVQGGKLLVFHQYKRPWRIFEDEGIPIYLLEDFVPHSNNSFPSGHSASGFCIATLLAFAIPAKRYNWVLIFLALAVAYSRMYLGQHWFIDTYMGAVVGFFSALVGWWALAVPRPGQKEWLDKKLSP